MAPSRHLLALVLFHSSLGGKSTLQLNIFPGNSSHVVQSGCFQKNGLLHHCTAQWLVYWTLHLFKSHPLLQRVGKGISGWWGSWDGSTFQAAVLPVLKGLGIRCSCRCYWVSPTAATPLPLGPLWGAEVGHRAALDTASKPGTGFHFL